MVTNEPVLLSVQNTKKNLKPKQKHEKGSIWILQSVNERHNMTVKDLLIYEQSMSGKYD